MNISNPIEVKAICHALGEAGDNALARAATAAAHSAPMWGAYAESARDLAMKFDAARRVTIENINDRDIVISALRHVARALWDQGEKKKRWRERMRAASAAYGFLGDRIAVVTDAPAPRESLN